MLLTASSVRLNQHYCDLFLRNMGFVINVERFLACQMTRASPPLS